MTPAPLLLVVNIEVNCIHIFTGRSKDMSLTGRKVRSLHGSIPLFAYCLPFLLFIACLYTTMWDYGTALRTDAWDSGVFFLLSSTLN